MRIAILGASHWHVSLMYLEALKNLGEEVVAAGDTSTEKVDLVADKVDCPRYTDYEKLLAETRPDFIFAHAPHDEMTALADWLVERRLPFHMEKPMGTDWRQLAPVAARAAEAEVYASVALVSRYYGIVSWLKEHQAELGAVQHYYYRLFAGDPSRYRTWGVEWMLDPARAGAGPLFNFGPHVIDLFLYLVTPQVTEISCHWARGLHGEAIEDLATVTMVGADGQIGVGEVSYTMPDGYERYFSVASTTLQTGGPDMGEMTVQWRDGRSEHVVGNNFDQVYGAYTADCLARFREGRSPLAGIDDMVQTLRLMNAARCSAQSGQPVQLDDRWAL